MVKKTKEKFDDEIEEGGALGGEVEDEELEDEGEEAVERPSKSEDVIFVNNEKLSRAKGILELVSGKRVPRDANEAERTEHYRAQMNAASVTAKDKKALQFLYELLGGLVRTREEQREADKKSATIKAKHKKRAVESDAGARNADA